jgi:glycosyltransferase involved in cell wall biosynthesis
MESAMGSFAVIIPAYNAESSLQELISRIRRSLESPRIIVINDGSTDRTGDIADSARVHSLNHENNRGKGAALQTGFDFVKNFTEIDFVFTVDADLQHRPEDIPDFIRAQQRTNADIVIGWRKRTGTGMPVHRIASNTLTSTFVSIKTRRRIKDSQCGFRMIRRNVLENIHLNSTGYEAETEFLIKAAKQCYKIEFVPIKTVYGNEKSHMTNWTTTVNFIKVLFRGYA